MMYDISSDTYIEKLKIEIKKKRNITLKQELKPNYTTASPLSRDCYIKFQWKLSA